MKQLFLIALLITTTIARAGLPVQGVDPLKLEADFAGTEILDGFSFASTNCREDYFACGSQSEFINLNETGLTNDGRIATLWVGRWFFEPMTYRVAQRIWSEIVYIEFWTGIAPFSDFTGASMVVQGVNFWSFADSVLESTSANKKGKFTLSAPGWYGVNLSDSSLTAQTAAPANIILTAVVSKVPGATEGEIELNFSTEVKQP